MFSVRLEAENTPNPHHTPSVTRETHGGTSIEEPPGLREGKLGALYLSYVRDPDGHKLCALFRPK